MITFTVFSALFALALAWHGRRKGSLSMSGSLAAFFVGFVTLLAGPAISAALLSFYLSSSKLTKMGANAKRRIEESYDKASARTAVQVLSNGGFAAACSVLIIAVIAPASNASPSAAASGAGLPGAASPLHLAVVAGAVGSLAGVCGDTWASEVGVLSKARPRLITAPWRHVPAGCNGGVTLLGLTASALGGAFVSFCSHFFALLFSNLAGVTSSSSSSSSTSTSLVSFYTLPYVSSSSPNPSLLFTVALGFVAGLFASIVDSFLGATLQESRFSKQRGMVVESGGEVVAGLNILDNHQVNLLASVITGLVFAYASWSSWF